MADTKLKSKRGGKREGAGRKPLPDHEKKKSQSIRLPESFIGRAKVLASLGLHSAFCLVVASERDNHQPTNDKEVRYDVFLFDGNGGIDRRSFQNQNDIKQWVALQVEVKGNISTDVPIIPINYHAENAITTNSPKTSNTG